MAQANVCQCVQDNFKVYQVTTAGEFGYYVLHAKSKPPHEDCLDQVKAAHAGDAWARVSVAEGWYVMKCHYTICSGALANLINILGEPGFIGIEPFKNYRERH